MNVRQTLTSTAHGITCTTDPNKLRLYSAYVVFVTVLHVLRVLCVYHYFINYSAR